MICFDGVVSNASDGFLKKGSRLEAQSFSSDSILNRVAILSKSKAPSELVCLVGPFLKLPLGM